MSVINDQIKSCLTTDKEDFRAAYIAPFYKQAKAVAWDYVKKYAGVIPDVQFNEAELRVDFPNGARYRLYGADNGESLRGIYLDDVVLDEVADMRPSFFPEIIRPALADRKGRATFIGTPKGHNAFYDVVENAKSDEEWFFCELKASDTGYVDPSELKAAKRAMSVDQYAQEFECSFEAAIKGAYFAEELKAAEDDGRIKDFPHDAHVPVDVFFDLGRNDSTAMWFIQDEHMGFARVLDFYEDSMVHFNRYIEVLQEKKAKGYIFGDIVIPHDGESRKLEAQFTVRELLEQAGFNVTTQPRTQARVDDIHLATAFIKRAYFHKANTKDGRRAMQNYHRQYDEKRQVFRDTPNHNWASNAADAWRYAAVHYRNPTSQNMAVPEIDYSWVT